MIDRIRSFVKNEPPKKEALDINEKIRAVLILTRSEAVKILPADMSANFEFRERFHRRRTSPQRFITRTLSESTIEEKRKVGFGSRWITSTDLTLVASCAIAIRVECPDTQSLRSSQPLAMPWTTRMSRDSYTATLSPATC